MAGIDDYLFHCAVEDEIAEERDQEAEREIALQSAQIRHEAEVRCRRRR